MFLFEGPRKKERKKSMHCKKKNQLKLHLSKSYTSRLQGEGVCLCREAWPVLRPSRILYSSLAPMGLTRGVWYNGGWMKERGRSDFHHCALRGILHMNFLHSWHYHFYYHHFYESHIMVCTNHVWARELCTIAVIWSGHSLSRERERQLMQRLCAAPDIWKSARR